MDLVIDVGNTLKKVAVFTEDSKMLSLFKVKNIEITLLEDIFSKYSIKRTIISTVSVLSEDIINWLENNTDLVNLKHSSKFPIEITYSNPETLGTDRISNAVGANALFPDKNVLSIVAGTCLVADFVNSNNEYLGGSISPGLKMRFSALKQYTARLPLIEVEKIDFLTGKSTQESILSGVINGIVFEIEGIIDAYSKRYSDLKIIFSGGDSELLGNYIKKTIFAAQNPILLGLHKILQFNASEKKIY